MTKGKLVPRLRFKEFYDSGTWLRNKLGNEVYSIIAGGDIDREKVTDDGEYPILANALVNDGIIGYYKNYYTVKGPAVTVTGRGDIGHAKAREYNFTPVVRLLTIKSKHDSVFLENSINNYKSSFESTGVPQLTVPKLSAYKLYFPRDIQEEKKIGIFFKKIDQMIQLQQAKLNKVKDIKSAYLSEMFPKEGEIYPKKRFEGFRGPWQQFKLGELGQFRSNGVNKKIKINDNPAYLLNYMDVYNKLNINPKNYKNLMKVTATNRELQDNNIVKNDVFFTPTSETADDIGRVLTIEHNLPKTVYSYHLIRFRPFEDRVYVTFPNYGFSTQYLRNQMKIAAQGVQRFVIGITAFENLKVYLPSYEEQQKIAEFFKVLDNQIASEEEKLDKLEKLKQAYLNDMIV